MAENKSDRKASWPRGLRTWDARSGKALLEVIVPGSEGKTRRQKHLVIKSRFQADEKIREFRREVAREFPTAPWEFIPEVVPNEARTFFAFVTADRDLLLGGISEGRQELEGMILDSHLLPVFGPLKLDVITDRHLDRFLAGMRAKTYDRKGEKRNYSPSYINTVLRVLRKVLHRAVQYREIAEFPFRSKNKWETEPVLKNELSAEERAAFLAAFHNRDRFRKILVADGINPSKLYGGFNAYFDRYSAFYPFFLAAIHTGLRQADLMDLQWGQVNFETKTITRVMNKEKERVALIPISAPLHAALSILQKRTGYVFTSSGKPLSLSTVKRYFILAKKVAGITRRVRFHDLRHTTGSTLVSSGASLVLVSSILGHASTATTQRYAKPSAAAVAATSVAFDHD